jgi:hypothetical protein
MVANPATGWSAPLPPPPPPKRPELERLRKFLSGDETPEVECLFDDAYLAFDPTVSSHYQVVLVPRIPYIELDIEPDEDPIGVADPSLLELEWPPSSCVLTVFSSSTKQWEERTFFRVGEAAGTIADWGEDYMWSKSNAVYWHGALYVHCQKSFVMRYLSNSPCLIGRYILILYFLFVTCRLTVCMASCRLSLSGSTYQIIKPPEGLEPESCQILHHLGKSKKGVYYASIIGGGSYRLRVWVLDESCVHTKWVLEHDRHLQLLPNNRQGPWILQNINYSEEKYIHIIDDDDTMVVDENSEWNSDDDDDACEEEVLDRVDKRGGELSIHGFHPFKEIIFLSRYMSRGFAYHLNTSKIQDIGNLGPKHYNAMTGPRGYIGESFPYTPCWME